ncbi:hypothetical protein C5S35_05365 [Candidatus Methanophagaceae archaeon]|nr:hypothetical protein C5S35_05365 [Methanophagales archaeon]
MSEDVKGEKINIFKIGDLWCFKYFFGDRELFDGLSEYYNRPKYRFELKDEGERSKVTSYLKENGFDTVTIEDTAEYTVKIDRFKKYAPILRNSIDSTEGEKERVFIMKDLASVEEAVDRGAEKV